jgi:oligopeptidase A
MSTNPLRRIPHHPAFDRMQPEQAEAALRALLAEAAAAVDRLEASHTPTWEGLMDPLHRACEPLHSAWGIVSHFLSVMNSDGWRRAHDAVLPDVVAFNLRVSQSHPFHRGYLALRAADRAGARLSGPRRRILESTIRAVEQAGVGLEGAARERFNAIQQELAQLSTRFSNNLLDAIKSYSLWVREPHDVEGLPESLLAATARAAREAGEPQATAAAGPWRITLDGAVAVPFLLHCRNRALRETFYRAHVTRASTPPHDNSEHLEQVLALRREMAGLLGFATYADLSLSRKMAPSVAAVDRFSADLAAAAAAPAAGEAADLLAFARARGFAEESLAPWDIAFWAERLREARYDYREEDLRPYFQFPRVLEGMFALAERLFGIRVEAADGAAPVWHPDVRFFRVYQAAASAAGGGAAAGELLAEFYLDPYSRPASKNGGAWMNFFRSRDRRPDGAVGLPLTVLVCNQTVPADGRPSLMRFDEVTTLFHEFGHALQHMLTTVEDPEAAGINNIEWDAVEIASQFMENWCYDRATLRGLSRHLETGAVLPDGLFDKLRAARTYRAASQLLRQIFLGVTDMDLHARYPRPEWPDANAVKCAAARRLLPQPILPEDRMLCGFSHIFAGGYAAGYFSYKWSEVLSADAFAAFEDAGLADLAAVAAMGRRYRDTILALGGGTHPMEVFQAFRGRPPSVEPLLRHAGLRTK